MIINIKITRARLKDICEEIEQTCYVDGDEDLFYHFSKILSEYQKEQREILNELQKTPELNKKI